MSKEWNNFPLKLMLLQAECNQAYHIENIMAKALKG